MKVVFIIFLLLLINMVCKGQELALVFNSTHSGRNLAINYIKDFNKNEIGVGLRYNINMFAHTDDQMNVFHNRQFATKPLHHIGFQAYYNRYIWSKLFAFYDIQLSHSETFNRMYLRYIYDPNVEEPTRDDILYRKVLENFGPFTWIEQNVGIGLKLNITESIFLTSKIGVGVMLLYGTDIQLPSTISKKPEWEMSMLMSMGLSYKF